MADKSLMRLFMIIGIIVLVAVLGSFIGVYLLFLAFDAYGVLSYVMIGGVFLAVIITLYILDVRREKREKMRRQIEGTEDQEFQEREDAHT